MLCMRKFPQSSGKHHFLFYFIKAIPTWNMDEYALITVGVFHRRSGLFNGKPVWEHTYTDSCVVNYDEYLALHSYQPLPYATIYKESLL